MEANSEAKKRVLSHITHTDGTAELNGTLKYQGRKTSRVNSEQRRRTILEAALRIVVRDGVRGVRHRAVAREAEVPLSATTYYFKDINDLITDTFTLFVEMGTEKFKAYWEESEGRLQEALSNLDGSPDSRARFINKMSDLALDYVLTQIRDHQDYLAAERAFQLECLRNETLRPVAFNHQLYLSNSLESLFQRVGSSQPAVDARLFVSVMMHVEYEGLVQGEPMDPTPLRIQIHRQISSMLRNIR